MKYEVSFLPVENEEYEWLMHTRAAESMKPKKETIYIPDIFPPGTLPESDKLGGFATVGYSYILACGTELTLP